MSDEITRRSEKRIEQPQPLEGVQDIHTKIADAQDAAASAQSTELRSAGEKLKPAVMGQGEGGAVESKINQAKDVSTLIQPADAADYARQAEIKLVDVSRLPGTPDIHGAQDFKGKTLAERQAHCESLKADLLRHEEMRRYIERGYGGLKTWDALDQDQKLGNFSPDARRVRGYNDAYQALYYKADAITVSEIDGRYVDILNGEHRIFLARELGIEKLPVYVDRLKN